MNQSKIDKALSQYPKTITSKQTINSNLDSIS